MKFTFSTLLGGLGSVSKLNAILTAIQTEFQDKVLYRDNPDGEPNQMESDLDLNSNDVLNVGTVETQSLKLGSTFVTTDVSAMMYVTVTSAPYNADNTGVDDAGPAIQAAIDAVSAAGGGVVFFPAGDYKIATTISTASRVNLKGESSVGYFASAAAGTRLVRDADLLTMFSHTGNLYWVADIELEGNGGELEASRCTAFLKPNSGGGSGLWLDRVTVSNFWHVAYHSSSFGGVMATRSLFADCISGFVNTSDSVYTGNLFTRMKFASLRLNVGGVRITDNMFEFNHDNTEAAYPIYLQSNANEILIHGNRFDRNAGNSVYASGGRDITIADNHFMRCAWGSDLFDYQRASIYAANVTRIHVTGNTCYAANSNPSLIRGMVSPLYFFIHDNCDGVVEEGNNFSNVPGKIYLKSGVANPHSVAPVWTASGSGTGEWYLTDNVDANGNPYIPEPDAIIIDGTTLSTGTAGSLTAGQWDWADNDSLGFNTVYVRITGDGTPSAKEIYAWYNHAPVTSGLNSTAYTQGEGYKTDSYTDVTRRTLIAQYDIGTGVYASRSGSTLTVRITTGTGIVPGDLVRLSNAATVVVADGVYPVDTITNVGVYDEITITSAGGAATGTIDAKAAIKHSFVLNTDTVCKDSHVLPTVLRVVADQATTSAYHFGDFPVLLRSVSGAVSAAMGTQTVHVSNLDVDAYTSYDNNSDLVLRVRPWYTGRELRVEMYNTSDYIIETTIGVLR